MAYEITITDSTGTMTINFPAPPLVESTIEGATDVTTLDLNVYTDFYATKRAWSNSIPYMTKALFDQIKGFYDRQWTTYQYPEITITDLGVSSVVVRMTLSPRSVVNNCGNVEDVEIGFRETVQMTDWGSS